MSASHKCVWRVPGQEPGPGFRFWGQKSEKIVSDTVQTHLRESVSYPCAGTSNSTFSVRIPDDFFPAEFNKVAVRDIYARKVCGL